MITCWWYLITLADVKDTAIKRTPEGGSPTLFEQWCGFFCVRPGHKNQISESAVRWYLRLFVLIREDQNAKPFADVITKAALSSQLFKEPESWYGRGSNQ